MAGIKGKSGVYKRTEKSNNAKGKHWKIKDTSRMNQDKKGKKRPPFSREWKREMSKARKGKRLPEETKRKLSESMKGEKHWNWIKDRSLLKTDRLKMYDTKYKYWMLEVKKRDKWKCRIDNKDCQGEVIAHHILSWRDFPELRYNIKNGITLCQAHHPHKWAEEKRLIPLFSGLVSVSN